jgi:hypothetical protein
MNIFDWVVVGILAVIVIGAGLVWIFAQGMSDKVD